MKIQDRFDSLFQLYSCKYDLDWMLMKAQGYQESGLVSTAFNENSGAKGLMQFMDATGEEISKKIDYKIYNPYDAVQAIHMGCYYMNQLVKMFDDHTLALMAYNWGMGNVKKYLKGKIHIKNVPRETLAYVAQIYKWYYILRNEK